MLKFTGKGVYGAIAVGKASVVFKKKNTKIRRTGIVDIEAEFARVEAAKAKAANATTDREAAQKALADAQQALSDAKAVGHLNLNKRRK